MRLRTIAVAVGLLLIAIPYAIFAQSILTVAGGGTDDGRPATVAGLYFPVGVALDAGGNLYIADFYDCRIRKMAAGSGIISTVAGNGSQGFSGDSGAATAAGLNLPSGMVPDSVGNLYIADTYNQRIRKVAAGSGIISTVAGSGSTGFTTGGFSGDGGAATAAGLSSPSGVALDSAGNLYIADSGNGRVRKVAAGSGIITTVAGNGSQGFSGDGGPATAAGLFGPSGVTLDSAGNLYIVDQYNLRIRKVAAGSGIITTAAGNGSRGFSGDGGAATAAGFAGPSGVALDFAGNLYIADGSDNRVRKVAAGNGIISTVAGNGSQGSSGDGGAAMAAGLNYPGGVVLDSAGILYIADTSNNRIRKVTAGSGIITTVAGNGSQGFTGDGSAATAAGLNSSRGVSLDSGGNVYIADSGNNRIRKVAAGSGIITTVAGNGSQGSSGDGGAATAAGLIDPYGVTLDSAGNLYIADTENHLIRKVAAGSGIITTVAGNGSLGFSGDGGAATESGLYSPRGVALNSAGDLYIADTGINRIQKVAAGSGIITTVAGNGSGFFGGDGGAATAAGLNYPSGVALDSAENLYIADTLNNRIRKVAAGSGTITTVAGNGSFDVFSGDGGAATAAGLSSPFGVALDSAGNLYIGDAYNNRIRKVAAGSGIITTVAGNGGNVFSGDGGPATAAGLSRHGAVALDTFGNLYIADTESARIRAVFACVTVPAPSLQQPSNASTSVLTSPPLAWSAVKGAFHYDVYLDTANPPQKVVAANVTAPYYNPSNLEPLATYYWKVVAKGDPFCTPFSAASSPIFSFTTAGNCSPPGPFSANAPVTGTSVTVAWQPSERASSYDLYLSPSSPPRVFAVGLTATTQSVTGLAPGTMYIWKIVAHASCDGSRTSETAVRSFSTAGGCGAAGGFNPTTPADGDLSVPATATLSWQPSSGAASYDLYLGSGSNPLLYMSDVLQTSVVAPRLTPGAEYSWQVVAKAACDPTKSAVSAVRRFTVASCGVPSAPAGIAAQSSVAAGATYTLRWSDAVGLDAGGSYLVERATDAAFNSTIDRQQTIGTSASFVTKSAGTYYHRIRSIAGCDATERSAPSESVQVTVNAAASLVVFSMLPRAVITKLGEKLEDQKSSFALENLGTTSVQVLVGYQLNSITFFKIVDPFGGDAVFVTLEPRKPKTLDIHYSGPPDDQPGTYQGSIYVMSGGQGLASPLQAYVNLKVGGDANAAAPQLLVNGLKSEFAYFPPVTGDDSARPAIQVDLSNTGTVPMEVAGEIGPEAWLKMEKDWNAAPVPVSVFRTLRLSTQRTLAVAGSALPRYTYLTVRNKAGDAARLLVEDSGGITNTTGRSTPLGAGEMSAIVPFVASGTAVIVTNSGGDPVPVDMVYTPEGSDGFDAATVLRASIVIPPNDVVSLTDPLVQIFSKAADATGSIEILSAKLAQLAIRAEVRKPAIDKQGNSTGGVYTSVMPVAMRGEGARVGSAHRVAGITSTSIAPGPAPTVAIGLHDPLRYESYNGSAFTALTYNGVQTVQNGSATSTGSMYIAPGGYPFVLLDDARNVFMLHPGTFDSLKEMASLGYPVTTSGRIHLTGSFARANDARAAGDGVRVFVLKNSTQLFFADIGSDFVVNSADLFGGAGVSSFDLNVDATAGDLIHFVVSAGSQQSDGTFDDTALKANIALAQSPTDTKTALILAETSGREKTTAHIALYDNIGTKRGEQTIDIGRYGTERIDDVSQTLAGGAMLSGGRVDVDILNGGGAVMALAVITDGNSGAGAVVVGRPTAPEVHLSSLGRPIRAEATSSSALQTFTIPGAITNGTLKTTIGLSASSVAVNATVALHDSTTGQTTKQTISVAAGQTSEIDIPTGSGTVNVTTDAPVSVYARVRGTNIADALPIVSAYSEGLTGGGNATPLYADGLEHSIDATRGRKTSLILTEVAGQSATVNLRLYEPGSRTAAVAEKDFTMSANGELRLDNLFVSMGLESSPDDLDQRRKNQVNVAAVATVTSGGGVIAAEALMTDNKTGDRRTIQFIPAGGVPVTSIQRGTTTTTPPTRRRAVGK